MEPAGSTFFFLFVVFVLAAPLYKGGNRPLPLLLLELAAVGFLFAIVQRGLLVSALKPLPRSLAVALVTLLVYPLVQLVPIPEFLWRMLPGHSQYLTVLEQYAALDAAHTSRTISIVPASTEAGWLALLLPLAGLLAVQGMSQTQVARLLLAMAIFTGVEALVGSSRVDLQACKLEYSIVSPK